MDEPLIFAPSESHPAGSGIALAAGWSLAPLEERTFEQAEFKLRPLHSVRGRTVVVIQSLAATPEAPSAYRLLRLLFLLSGLRDAGASRLEALIPYLAYARKDRRTQPRDPVYTRYVAQLLESTGLQRLVVLDVHNPAALDNAFRVHVDHLSALPLFAWHFLKKRGAQPWAVASPDVGGIKRAQLFRELLQGELRQPVDLLFVEKRRVGGRLSGGTVVGDAHGKSVAIIDDLCSSGTTLLQAAASLREAGASSIHAVVTHAPLPHGLERVLADDLISELVVTDSVGVIAPPAPSPTARLTVLPTAPLFAQALVRPLRHLPLTDLLQHWPPPD